MEGLEDNNIKQTNSCCNKSKKKKVIIIVIAILCVAAVIGFVITKVVTTPKVEIDYGTSDIYTQKDMDEAIKVIKRKIRHMKGFELHNHTPEQTYSNLPPDMLYYTIYWYINCLLVYYLAGWQNRGLLYEDRCFGRRSQHRAQCGAHQRHRHLPRPAPPGTPGGAGGYVSGSGELYRENRGYF